MSRSARERGAVAAVVGILMVVVAGMAAVTLDLGQKYNARRNAQSAVDIGLLSGAQDVPFDTNVASERIASEIRKNLDMTFTDTEWNSMWSLANCSDPDRLPTRGTVNNNLTNCISFDTTGRARVRLPDIETPALFGGIFGTDEVIVTADAVAFVRYAGIGGVLPFTVLGGAEDGSQICLRSSSGGSAIPPCEGSQSGNFHALEISIYGDPAFETETIACNTNDQDVFTINVAKGIDHLLRIYSAGTGVTDTCAKPFGPNQFYTQTGLGNGLWEGLVTGEEIQGVFFEGRLTNLPTSGSTIELTQGAESHTIDNTPLWAYIPLGFSNDDAPVSCHRETFDALSFTAASANIETCLTAYKAGVDAGETYAPLFTVDSDGDGEYDISTNPRFAIVPQTIETTLPRGRKVVRVGGFRSVWVQGLYFPNGGSTVIVDPGDPRTTVEVPSGGSPLDQVTGWLLPQSTVDSIIGIIDSAGGEVSGSNTIELEE